MWSEGIDFKQFDALNNSNLEEEILLKTKQFTISKQLVMEAYKLVKSNKGSSGVDKQTIAKFGKDLKNNLYKIWNRMSSGSYFPNPVKEVLIPKKDGGKRTLGIPTVSDRIAQMVVKLILEPRIDPIFHKDSYGYRPNKSAHDAIGITRKRCWKYDYVLEFDIKGLFDNIDHELLMKAVKKHVSEKWIILYIKRWLKAPTQGLDGILKERNSGTPQGGVISPLLSNLFLHYVFDKWMSLEYANIDWCRYADDGIIHFKTAEEAELVRSRLEQRFNECGLEVHPEKTKIIYCKDNNRRSEYPNTSFDFLGYCFRRRVSRNSKTGGLFMNFSPGVSKSAAKSMHAETRKQRFARKSYMSIEQIAKRFNPVLRGWIGYYGRYNRWSLYRVFRHFNLILISWAQRKYKKMRTNKSKAATFVRKISEREPNLFAHWKVGMVCTFA